MDRGTIVFGQAQLSGDCAARCRLVSGDHHDPNAGTLASGNGVGNALSWWIVQAKKTHETQLGVRVRRHLRDSFVSDGQNAQSLVGQFFAALDPPLPLVVAQRP